MNQIMKSIIRYSLLLCLALVCGFLASCADDLLVTPTTDTVGQPLELTVSQATLEKKTVINGDNAYSDNYWPLDTYPHYCVKFDSFSADTDAPDYKDDVIN